MAEKQEAAWEYKTVRVPPRNSRRAHDRALNKMAGQGWELIEVKFGGLLRNSDLATFKRQR